MTSVGRVSKAVGAPAPDSMRMPAVALRPVRSSAVATGHIMVRVQEALCQQARCGFEFVASSDQACGLSYLYWVGPSRPPDVCTTSWSGKGRRHGSNKGARTMMEYTARHQGVQIIRELSIHVAQNDRTRSEPKQHDLW